MEIQYERGFDREIVEGLRQKGHKAVELDDNVELAAIVTAISTARGCVEAAFDPRNGGGLAIF